MSNPKVSICIPTYNGSQFIKDTLDAIKHQSYPNIEIIVTDDCSTDSTVNIIEENFPDVVLLKNEKRLGLTGNWRHAVSFTTGKYIKLMGQDDILPPDAIELQVRLMETDSDAVLCTGQTEVIDTTGKRLMVRKLSRKDFIKDGIRFAKSSLWYRNIFCEPSAILYKSGINADYDDRFMYVPDWDHNIAVSIHGKVCYVAKTVMAFRISDSSETSRIYNSKIDTMNKESDILINKYRKELNISLFQYTFFRLCSRIRTYLRYFYMRIMIK